MTCELICFEGSVCKHDILTFALNKNTCLNHLYNYQLLRKQHTVIPPLLFHFCCNWTLTRIWICLNKPRNHFESNFICRIGHTNSTLCAFGCLITGAKSYRWNFQLIKRNDFSRRCVVMALLSPNQYRQCCGVTPHWPAYSTVCLLFLAENEQNHGDSMNFVS